MNEGINLKRSKEKIEREGKKTEATAGKVWGIWRTGNWHGKHKSVVNLSIACFISSKPNWTQGIQSNWGFLGDVLGVVLQ